MVQVLKNKALSQKVLDTSSFNDDAADDDDCDNNPEVGTSSPSKVRRSGSPSKGQRSSPSKGQRSSPRKGQRSSQRRSGQPSEEKGLSELVRRCLGRALDKKQQMSDWERRPLRPAQIRYAGECQNMWAMTEKVILHR